jgi:hypothetical protein
VALSVKVPSLDPLTGVFPADLPRHLWHCLHWGWTQSVSDSFTDKPRTVHLPSAASPHDLARVLPPLSALTFNNQPFIHLHLSRDFFFCLCLDDSFISSPPPLPIYQPPLLRSGNPNNSRLLRLHGGTCGCLSPYLRHVRYLHQQGLAPTYLPAREAEGVESARCFRSVCPIILYALLQAS